MAVVSQMSAQPRAERERAPLMEPRLPTLLGLLAAFVAVWTLYFAISDAPGAIHHDAAEAYVWGREFQLGYVKHPPFWAWICGLWFLVFPRVGWAFAMLSSLNAAVGLAGSWALIGEFARGRERVAATALLLLTPFYTFLSYRYNANTIFLSVWPWTLVFFVRSIERRGLRDAVLFGALMGVALLSKYYALILGAACFLAAAQHPARWRYFGSPAPYVSVAVTLAVCAPHLWWLVANDAPPMHYVAGEAGRGPGVAALYAAFTLVGQLAQNSVVLLVVALICGGSPRAWLASLRLRWADEKFRMLTTLLLVPLALTVLSGFAIGMKISTNMTVGLFSLLPLWAIEIAGAQHLDRLSRVALRLAVAANLGALALSPAFALARGWWELDEGATQPRKELALEATRLWRETTGLPLVYVGGSVKYDTAVAFYSPDRPHGFDHFEFARSPWVTPQALAAHGLLAVCEADDTDCLAASAKFATPQSTRREIALSHEFLGHKAAPVHFVLLIVPPRG